MADGQKKLTPPEEPPEEPPAVLNTQDADVGQTDEAKGPSITITYTRTTYTQSDERDDSAKHLLAAIAAILGIIWSLL